MNTPFQTAKRNIGKAGRRARKMMEAAVSHGKSHGKAKQIEEEDKHNHLAQALDDMHIQSQQIAKLGDPLCMYMRSTHTHK